jgi:hypothetical protein
VALVFERPLSRAESLRLHDEVFRAWSASVVRAGLKPPSPEYGVRVVRVSSMGDAGNVAAYVSKVEGLAHEMVRLDRKSARGKGFAPFELLRLAACGDGYGRARWEEFEVGSRGRRALTFSKGLRDRLGMGAELVDDELSDPSREARCAGRISRRDWDWLRYHPVFFEMMDERLTPESVQADLDAARSLLWSSMPPEALPEGHPDREYLEVRDAERARLAAEERDGQERGRQLLLVAQ